MPATVNIKRRKPRGGIGPDLWNVVVHGPPEVFRKPLRRFLEMQGLTELEGGPEALVWASRPAPVPPPLYLAGLLRRTYGLTVHKDIREMAEQPLRPVMVDDSLARLSGNRRVPGPGQQALRVEIVGKTFVANCDEENCERRLYLDGAGWLPIPAVTDRIRSRFGTLPYISRDPFIAGNLAHLMTPPVEAALREALAAAHRNIRRSRSHHAPEDFAVPCPEGTAYLPFQAGGIMTFAAERRSGILADDMGLGKTIQGIGVLNARPDARNVLVICQANMRLKWVREIRKWAVNRDLSVDHAEGDTFPDTNIVVINYDILARHKPRLDAREWDLILCDEGHNMKNPEAKRTLSVLGDVINPSPELPAIPRSEGGQIIHMTGTPKPNRISDLWPLLTSTRPDIWGRGPEAYRAFLNRYQPPKFLRRKLQRRGREVTFDLELPGTPMRELELQLRLRGSGSFVRRLKRDTDLPPKFRTPIELPFRLTREDREALAQVDADIEALARRLAGDAGGVRVGESSRATEIIDTISGIVPGSPSFPEGARVRANLGRLKAPHVARFIVEELRDDDDLDPELRRKTVVFAHHKDVIRIIAEEIRKTYPSGVLVYDGSVNNPARRQAMVDLFNEDPDVRVLIMSLAGASGITLTAAHRMRIAEPDWTPANMAQIEDRIWRIGQEQPCDIGYLFVPESHDLNIGLSLIRKMESEERALNSFRFGQPGRRAPAGSRRKEGPAEPDGSEERMPVPAAEGEDPSDRTRHDGQDDVPDAGRPASAVQMRLAL